jgi:hypothetical protein
MNGEKSPAKPSMRCNLLQPPQDKALQVHILHNSVLLNFIDIQRLLNLCSETDASQFQVCVRPPFYVPKLSGQHSHNSRPLSPSNIQVVGRDWVADLHNVLKLSKFAVQQV